MVLLYQGASHDCAPSTRARGLRSMPLARPARARQGMFLCDAIGLQAGRSIRPRWQRNRARQRGGPVGGKCPGGAVTVVTANASQEPREVEEDRRRNLPSIFLYNSE